MEVISVVALQLKANQENPVRPRLNLLGLTGQRAARLQCRSGGGASQRTANGQSAWQTVHFGRHDTDINRRDILRSHYEKSRSSSRIRSAHVCAASRYRIIAHAVIS
jgi:hypothetical protein